MRCYSKNTLKTHKGSILVVIILVTIGIFLAVDAGFFLYNPDRFTTSAPFCVLDIIRGNVLVLKKEALSWEKARSGMNLEPGSRIKTATDADAVVTFASGTTTKLEPGTDLIIDKIEESQVTPAYSVVLKQQSGKTWNQVDKAGGKASFQIRTTSADIVVHGTLFTTEVDETGKTTVQTTEGQVGVSAGGDEVQVAAGEMTEVKPHGQPSAPAPIPQANNELVITVNQPGLSLIKSPTGALIGYLKNGAKVNQISGSSVAANGESGQTIRIREPEAGDYTLTLQGITDGIGQVSVEGFIGGKTAFLRIESCNITAAKDTLLKLHYDVIDGLLQCVDASDQDITAGKAALASDLNEPASEVKSPNIQPAPADTNKTSGPLAKKDTSSNNGFIWFGIEKCGPITQWVSIGCFLFLMFMIFTIMRRKT